MVVLERRPRAVSYGFGIAFTSDALETLRQGDPETCARVAARALRWDALDIVHRAERVSFGGRTYYGLARIALLEALQERCQELGVALRFEWRGAPPAADLLVGADGFHSAVRKAHAAVFQPALAVQPDFHIWYGARQPFTGVTLIYRPHEAGLFIAHAYPMDARISTFIVDCSAKTFRRAGLAKLSDAETRDFLGAVFRRDLGGKRLLSRDSQWIHFTQVRNRRWVDGNVVLIGDAAHTVHFSAGQGTKLAFEDALELARALETLPVREGLLRFEERRKPVLDGIQDVSERNRKWLEEAEQFLDLPTLDFAARLLSAGHESERAAARAEATVVQLYKARQRGTT